MCLCVYVCVCVCACVRVRVCLCSTCPSRPSLSPVSLSLSLSSITSSRPIERERERERESASIQMIQIGLFYRYAGLICGHAGLFCRYTGLFGGYAGLFCGYEGYFGGYMSEFFASTEHSFVVCVVVTASLTKHMCAWIHRYTHTHDAPTYTHTHSYALCRSPVRPMNVTSPSPAASLRPTYSPPLLDSLSESPGAGTGGGEGGIGGVGGEEGAAQTKRGGGGDYVIAGDSDAQQCVRMALGYLPLTLQHTATHCNTLQHTATQSEWRKITCLSAIVFPLLPVNERASRVFHVCVRV